MIGGGRDRSDLESYNPDSFDESSDPNAMLGCHVGGFAGLNIVNPQPGRHYAWADDSPRGRMRSLHKGYIQVAADSPELAGYHHMLGHDHMDLDSANTGFHGVVLVWRSTKDEKRVRAEEQVLRDDLLRSGASEETFLKGATAQEIEQGGSRYKRPEHRSYTTAGEGENSEVTSSWTYDSGISS